MSNLVYAGTSGYSALAKLATGEIGLLNEVNGYARIDYVRRSVATMSGGTDSLPAYTVWAGNSFSPAQLMNPAISGPNADPDGDGVGNYAEFLAGTDPLNAASYLKLNLTPAPGATNSPLAQFRRRLRRGHRPIPSRAGLGVVAALCRCSGASNQFGGRTAGERYQHRRFFSAGDAPTAVTIACPIRGQIPVLPPGGMKKIAQRFNAGKAAERDQVPMACEIFECLCRPFGTGLHIPAPSAKALGYCRLSLRDKAGYSGQRSLVLPVQEHEMRDTPCLYG